MAVWAGLGCSGMVPGSVSPGDVVRVVRVVSRIILRPGWYVYYVVAGCSPGNVHGWYCPGSHRVIYYVAGVHQ